MAKIRTVVENTDFNSLPRILDTLAWYGGPHLYNFAFLSLLRNSSLDKSIVHTSFGYSSIVETESGPVGLIDDLLLLAHVKYPNLTYSETLQWQDNIPGSIDNCSSTSRPLGSESYDQELIRFID